MILKSFSHKSTVNLQMATLGVLAVYVMTKMTTSTGILMTKTPARNCEQDRDIVANKNDCQSYYLCLQIDGMDYLYIPSKCDPGGHFDPASKNCVQGPCPVPNYECLGGAGHYPHPSDCMSFYQCIEIRGTWFFYTYRCPNETHWSQPDRRCLRGRSCTTNSQNSIYDKSWLFKTSLIINNILDHMDTFNKTNIFNDLNNNVA